MNHNAVNKLSKSIKAEHMAERNPRWAYVVTNVALMADLGQTVKR